FREACPAEGDTGAVGARSAEKARARRERRAGRRRQLQPAPVEGGGCAGRGRLSDRRHPSDYRPERRFSKRTQSERTTLVPELPVQCRRAADPSRRLRLVLIPCACEGEAWTQVAVRDQAHEKRSGGDGGAERGDQGAL